MAQKQTNLAILFCGENTRRLIGRGGNRDVKKNRGELLAEKALKFCRSPGCPNLVKSGYCEEHKELEKIERAPDNRQSASARGYGTSWRAARARFLKAHPLCAICKSRGKIVPATVVDHIIPHKGNKKLFWDKSNWQALCKPCHDIKTAKEDGGFGHEIKIPKWEGGI